MAKRVLVVDDEKLIVKGIRYSLEQDSMVVEVAYDGRQALEMAQANAYDVILLDVMLPRVDGLSVCKKIKNTYNVNTPATITLKSGAVFNTIAIITGTAKWKKLKTLEGEATRPTSERIK